MTGRLFGLLHWVQNLSWCCHLGKFYFLVQVVPFSGIICLVFSVNIGLVPRIFSSSCMLILEDLILTEKSKGLGVLAFSFEILFWIEMLASSLVESSTELTWDQVVFLASLWCSGYGLFRLFFVGSMETLVCFICLLIFVFYLNFWLLCL